MVEKYLGRQQADDLFRASMIAELATEKQAGVLGDVGSLLSNGVGGVLGAIKEVPSSLGWLALTGAGLGTVGSLAYDAVKERMSHDDPEAEFNADIEALYEARRRELDDAKWMSKVRTMRDELKRGHKKMTTKEYAKAYKALEDALDERRG